MNPTLAERIRHRLTALDKSATSASVEAGLGRSAVADILTGNSGSPRLTTLEKLAGPLQCSLAYLVGVGDDPQPLLVDKDNAYTALDPVPSNIKGVLETGVFLEKHQDPSARLSLEHVIYNDVRIPEWNLSLYLIKDNSMDGLNILSGDVITVASPPGDVEINLSDGMLVSVTRSTSNIDLHENSLRSVELESEEILLISDCKSGKIEPIVIPTKEMTEVGGPAADLFENCYFDKAGSFIRINGIAIRLSRVFPLSL